MVVKQLNQALTDEQLREQWLKRLLPGLVITVIYFVFISSTLTGKSDKAEQAYKAMQLKGVDVTAFAELNQRKQKLFGELQTLKQRNQKVVEGVTQQPGLVGVQASVNENINQMVQLMMKHGIKPVEDRSLGEKKMADLPRSVADLKNWLNDILQKSDAVRVHQFEFIGSYVEVYAMLDELAVSDIKLVPLFLTMNNVDDQNQYIGKKAWILECWI